MIHLRTFLGNIEVLFVTLLLLMFLSNCSFLPLADSKMPKVKNLEVILTNKKFSEKFIKAQSNLHFRQGSFDPPTFNFYIQFDSLESSFIIEDFRIEGDRISKSDYMIKEVKGRSILQSQFAEEATIYMLKYTNKRLSKKLDFVSIEMLSALNDTDSSKINSVKLNVTSEIR